MGDVLRVVVVGLHLFISILAQSPGLEVRVSSPAIGVESIEIAWRVENSDEQIREVFITAAYVGSCTGVQVPPRMVVLSPPTSDSFTVIGLEEFSAYAFNVTLITRDRAGTAQAAFSTKGRAPSSPAALRLQGSTMTSLTLEWTPIPCLDLNSRLEEYIIVLTPYNPLQRPRQFITPFGSTNYTVTGLEPASDYSILLNATLTISDAILQNLTIATPINASTFQIPGPHTLRTTSIETTALSVSWQQEEPTDGLTRYEVVVQYTGLCDGIEFRHMATIPITSRMHTVQNLAAFGMYDVSVTAISATNQSATARIRTQTLPTAPQAPPTSVRAVQVEAFALTLSWGPIECPQRLSLITAYTVYYAPSSLYSESNRLNITGLTNTTVTIEDLIASTDYALQVVAVNREGLSSPPSPILVVTTSIPPPPPENLRVDSLQATSATLSWVQFSGFAYTIVATYLGPCSDAHLPPRRTTVQSGRGSIAGLEEFSSYVAVVMPLGGREAASVNFTTLSADPTPADDHVQHVSSTNSTVVLEAPPIDCIDQNGLISEFRLRYAESADFLLGNDIRSGLFTPGRVIVGNLASATQYTFQLQILTAQGGSVSLQPLTARTLGMTATPPLTDATPTPSNPPAALSPSIITTIIAVIGICAVMVVATVVLVCMLALRRRGQRVHRSDSERLIKDGGRFPDLVGGDSNPFAREMSSPTPTSDNEWGNFASGSTVLSPLSEVEFSKMDWMTGLGENTTAAMYEDDFDYDEKVFEPSGDEEIETKHSREKNS